ncbi:thioredoxin-disulfide reductase [Desulfovibrio inopinatus]|uniref:thioredoxin-disulfide reductase n=1 Tax=Desulfovibrio inopinatus TaxID=102109 RepID=UPI000401E80E|nr:thioredoxin-disulfide reductase [Desulfovibrio inopinatus]
MNRYDAIVIGGGPAGITAALYLLRFQVKVAVVEKLAPGGQVLRTHLVENYPGFPQPVEGWKLADIFAEHLKPYHYDTYNDEVSRIEVGKEMHRLKIGDTWVEARTIIVCTGAVYKELGLPGEKELSGKGVSYCATCDGNFFRDQVVAVIGGGNTALEESLYLARLVKKLYLLHRRDDFRGHKCFQNRCEVNPVITIRRSTLAKRILGDDKVTGIEIENIKTGEKEHLSVDGVFVFVGYDPHGDFYPPEIQLDERGFIITDAEMRTSVPGIFAAGDIRSKLCRQITTAVGDGATAANAAHAYMEEKGFI